MDSNTSEIMGKRLIEAAAYDPGLQFGYLTWKEQLEEETTYDLTAQKADTFEELAEKMGADPGIFVSTMNRYNESCARGTDDEFGKSAESLVPLEKPPYYAAFIGRFSENTMGGIINDTNLNVVRANGTTVAGLYTAGDCCRGLVVPENSMMKFGDCAWAMASGYLCAEHAASYLAGK
jgi:succinate dehydrogenase/fumarate reductase flavoprotein subunit